MFEWLFEWLYDDEYGRRRELSVTSEVWYDSSFEGFIVGYGVQERVDIIGYSKNLSDAAAELGEEINRVDRKNQNAISKVKSAEECALSLTVYYLPTNESYLIELSDSTGTTVNGVGNSTSDAFLDLSESVTVESRGSFQ